MKTFFFTVLFLFTSYLVFSQTISGKIVNKSQQPISEAYIINKKNDNNTQSNKIGNFILENCSVGDTLQVSLIGYQTKLVVINSLKQAITIVLDEKTISLDEVIISSKEIKLDIISKIDIQRNPVNSSQDLMRKVPGLFIGQHAGGGKAEQIFLRGFDIDHGTDINITVDDIPVNMVSHAHGQGYADLHFLIPETIEKIDFGKGPYYENKGNFTTAGYLGFTTKQKLKDSSIKLETGQFNTNRLLGMFNLINSNTQNAYVVTEFLSTDGYFESSQNFNRINLFGKYSDQINTNNKIEVIASYFKSKWNASGQIPQRAIDNGLITRFGSIDDTEGGNTSRTNVLINYNKIIDKNSSIKSSVFLSQYDFELYSNFTFFLEDPINGDQIRQKENRLIYGLNSDYNKSFKTENLKGTWKAGISIRNDQTKNTELSHTKNRTEILQNLKLGDINETNIGGYIGASFEINKWTFSPSLRIDYFNFEYNNKLITPYKTQKQTQSIINPKININYTPSQNLQFYLKTGKGFHSNDTRVVVTENGKKTLPSAYGFDVGYIWKPTPKMFLNVAYWYLFLEQEFVYVGDAGIVEPSGKTKRQGIDLSYRYQPLKWFYWNLDANYTYARALEELKGEDYIPLAPDFTLASGLNLTFKTGLYGGLNVRHLANRPAIEDNSIIAKGYTVTDLNAGYKWKKVSFGIQIQNLFNTKWNETQFATESRLQNETSPIEEIHFTPGTPFFIKGIIQYNF